MTDNKISLSGIDFKKVCEIKPDSDENDTILEYYPQSEYDNYSNLSLNKYGSGCFCRFKIPSGWKGKQGVYAVFVDTILKYVGECDNLENRFNNGYGIIHPRNCFEGGQSTNCRINKSIISEKKKGHNVVLYFFETDKRFDVEHYLILKSNPEWNLTIGKPSLRNKHSTPNNTSKQHKLKKITTTRSVSSGKYIPLGKYLSKMDGDKFQISFSEIESVLGFSLPKSAYKYREWWANGGHLHANAWLNSGWIVSSINLGEYIVFQRSKLTADE